MHPRNRLLHAFVDRELPADDETDVREHVAACDRCAARVARMRTAIAVLHGGVLDIDLAEPGAWTRAADSWQPPAIEDGVGERPETRVLDFEPRLRRKAGTPEPSRREGYRNTLRWAALFVFATTAIGVAALIVRNREPTPPATVEAAQPTPDADAAVAGQDAGSIFVQAANGAVTVQVMGAATGSFLYVEVADQANLSVQVNGDLTPRFRARDGAVDVLLDDARADVRVFVPASLRSATIRAGEQTLARVENGRVLPANALTGIPLRE